ncbi:hypothetical protein PROFUN_00695 [Planoprotostelium fungivorum]|uniref:CHCH domain-containing protein n=1 Tax=Planoprotostelium fungivorum TaxID=1890364 RepID=A0A2P6NU43_9EUKA|nr:hypothetical protein PROFUN_00695 [Planoprotostelium fungivorum]
MSQLDNNQKPNHHPKFGTKKPSQVSDVLRPCAQEAKLSIECQNWGFDPTRKNDCQKYIDAYKNCLTAEREKLIDPKIKREKEEKKEKNRPKVRDAPPQ